MASKAFYIVGVLLLASQLIHTQVEAKRSLNGVVQDDCTIICCGCSGCQCQKCCNSTPEASYDAKGQAKLKT
ncbi:hypothetical protein QJS10_CPA05g02116 [Acorus calamus]|uniref:Uncharacterized protein n=1 Tax=Acorus calamus TaxID=4465 RepID=A0AAV9EUL2_ACOCL|nr:hypothetical protein QJS10_CPA05g02116 [Acorus calamus]